MNSPFDMKSWELFDINTQPVVPWIGNFSNSHKFLLPAIKEVSRTELSIKLLQEGLVRLPFDKTIFEYGADIQEVDIDRVVFIAAQSEDKEYEFPLQLTLFPVFRTRKSGWKSFFNSPIMLETGAPSLKPRWSTHKKDKPYEDMAWKYLHILLDTLLLLSTNSLELKEVVIPEKLQKARDKSGKPPLYEFVVAEIKKEYLIRHPSIGTHASPIMHWRRGHYRKTSAGDIIPVRACLVGNFEYGFRDKVYDAKELHK